MLQQHIMDLTQAKFELQRGLTQQQALAATLANENESMTADFNRQVRGKVAMLPVKILCSILPYKMSV